MLKSPNIILSFVFLVVSFNSLADIIYDADASSTFSLVQVVA
jgi:hypothetical protein